MEIKKALSYVSEAVDYRNGSIYSEALEVIRKELLGSGQNSADKKPVDGAQPCGEYNTARDAIAKEANILRKEHSSKDCRFFANSVFEFLQQHP